MSSIQQIQALEILDSRGRPTVKAFVTLESGSIGTASVPSGRSTGSGEALEIRDGDINRYHGLGCRKAVANIQETINSFVHGREFEQIFDLDQALIELDSSSDKHVLGANAILAVSLAFARAQAVEQQLPLFQYLGQLIGHQDYRMPRPTINLFSGGLHAGKIIPIQDCLIVPVSATSIDEALAVTYAVFYAAAKLIKERYGMRLLTADEGGLSPDFGEVTEMFALAVEAIESAGFNPGEDVALALDVAASHFYQEGAYHLGGKPLPGNEVVDLVYGWQQQFPIISIEDGLAEDDWKHWPTLMKRMGSHTVVMGDDLLCTQEKHIQRAIDLQAANALLLKVNQVGTLYEASRALQLARQHNWTVTVSARSGETEDNWLADLAVGWGGDFIKIGSITQSERLAKYNRLLEIERFHHFPLRELSHATYTDTK